VALLRELKEPLMTKVIGGLYFLWRILQCGMRIEERYSLHYPHSSRQSHPPPPRN
jgi:hypothetical protein